MKLLAWLFRKKHKLIVKVWYSVPPEGEPWVVYQAWKCARCGQTGTPESNPARPLQGLVTEYCEV